MANHCEPDFRVDGITQNGYEEENAEEEYIQGENDDGYPVEPRPIIWQIVE